VSATQPIDLYAAVRDVLLSGDLERFKGMREGPYFEAKGKVPDDLATPDGRHELAKDVSAFADADGGHIVIGLTTQRVPDEKTDEVETLDLVPNGESLIGPIQGVLKQYVYPPIRDLQIEWSPPETSKEQAWWPYSFPVKTTTASTSSSRPSLTIRKDFADT